MNSVMWSAKRTAGALLIAGLLIAVVALVVMLASGALPGFAPARQGSLALMAPYAQTFRLLSSLYAATWIVQLLGLALLARLLLHSGAEQLAVLALALVLVGAMSGLLHGTFNAAVDTWAAEEAARTGSVPQAHEALDVWASSFFRMGYAAHLTGTALFGWAIARTGLLSPALGWAAAGWSLLWLAGLLAGVGAPAIPILMPAVIGIALLLA